MERLMNVRDIMERYGVNERTARKRMREMGALDVRPIVVPESAVTRWEAGKACREEGTKAAARKRAARAKVARILGPIQPVEPKPGQYISRVRPKIAK